MNVPDGWHEIAPPTHPMTNYGETRWFIFVVNGDLLSLEPVGRGVNDWRTRTEAGLQKIGESILNNDGLVSKISEQSFIRLHRGEWNGPLERFVKTPRKNDWEDDLDLC